MPRKTNKPTSSEKKHSAVPPKTAAPVAKPEAEIKKPVQVSVPEAAKSVTPVAASATKPEAAKSHPSEQVRSLIESLGSFDADIARDAATSLGHLGDASAVESLIEAVRNSSGYFHSVVRSAAAASLGQLKDTRAVDALIIAVQDPIAEPSCEAIRALAALGDSRATGTLLEVVRDQGRFFVPSVRRTAVLALAKLGGKEADAELRRIAADELEDSVIRDEAKTAISTR